MNELGEFSDDCGDEPLSSLSDCVTNAVSVLARLKGKGRIIWVTEKNHAYVVSDKAGEEEYAINLPTRVEIGGDIAFVKFEDYTQRQLLDMLASGQAVDIT